MFVIELIYKVDLAEIDANMAAHVAFLNKYDASGTLPGLRPQDPKGRRHHPGAGRETRQQMQAIVEEDPFVARGLADFRIVEFRASQRANDIQKRIER